MNEFDKTYNELQEDITGVYGDLNPVFTGVPEGDNYEKHCKKAKVKRKKPVSNNQNQKTLTPAKQPKPLVDPLHKCPHCGHEWRERYRI